MDIGTFLLMQSPSARSSQEIYARGVEQAQTGRRSKCRADQEIAISGHEVDRYPCIGEGAQCGDDMRVEGGRQVIVAGPGIEKIAQYR